VVTPAGVPIRPPVYSLTGFRRSTVYHTKTTP